jgi:selenophosphate synthetase-related protein
MKYRIWSFEHNAWWRPNWNGYTVSIFEAGLYDFEEATKIVEQANIMADVTGKINEEMRPVEGG